MGLSLKSKEQQLAATTSLVTGAGGFIGSHLVQRLVRAGSNVRALVRYNSRNATGFLDELSDQERAKVEIFHGDICDSGLVYEAVKGCDYVFHLAALIGIPYSYVAPQSYVDVNVQGTLNVLNAARAHGVTRVLQTSTSEVYGSAQYVPMDEAHPLHPQSPYAATKVGADQLAMSYHLSFGLPVTVVRPFNTYGPRQSTRAVVPTVCVQAMQGDSLMLGNLTALRDLTYVEDTCSGFLHAAVSSEAIGEVVNLGTGDAVSVQQVVDQVASILGKTLHIKTDPARIRPEASEVTRLVSNNAKAKAKLQWEPEVGLESGLRSLLEWLGRNEHLYPHAKAYTI